MGTTFTVRLPFGHRHLPEGNVVTASGSHAGPTVANPFLAEAMRWLPSGQIAEEAAPTAPVTGIARRDADGRPAPAHVLLADDNADDDMNPRARSGPPVVGAALSSGPRDQPICFRARQLLSSRIRLAMKDRAAGAGSSSSAEA